MEFTVKQLKLLQGLEHGVDFLTKGLLSQFTDARQKSYILLLADVLNQDNF